ncbi:MAG: hypothetical protein WD002_14135 [Pseudomonadales bacterium]
MSNYSYSGSCFCGAVQLAVSAEPAAMGLIDVYVAVIPEFPYQPGVIGLHASYRDADEHRV